MELEIEGLEKEFAGGVRALKGVNLRIGSGVLGLLGPNGAGKSTLMRILATVTRPSRGRILWNGVDVVREPNRLRAVLGYLPQDFGVYPHLSPIEFLEYLAAAKGLRAADARARIKALLEALNLAHVQHRPLGSFSGGMRQRVGMAQALLNDPKLLIVDEPTAGLDPEERVRLRNLLADLGGERIVILSTHVVSDVEATATRVALLAQGRLRSSGSPEELLRSVEHQVWQWTVPTDALAAVKQRFTVSELLHGQAGVQVRAVSAEPPTPSAQRVAPRLEDAYLAAMGQPRAEVA